MQVATNTIRLPRKAVSPTAFATALPCGGGADAGRGSNPSYAERPGVNGSKSCGIDPEKFQQLLRLNTEKHFLTYFAWPLRDIYRLISTQAPVILLRVNWGNDGHSLAI